MESHELLDKWLVRSTRRLINLAESLICQDGARVSIAEAEGFSILHQRAAALLNEKSSDFALPAMPSTLICHRERKLTDPLEIRMPFELQASSAQEAVYHCLIAHDAAARLNMPGLCSIDDELSNQFEGARMPTQAMLDAITPLGVHIPNIVIDENAILGAIRTSFKHFAPLFDVPVSLIETHDCQSNGICFVTTPRYLSTAQKLAAALRKHDIHAGTVCIKLIKPFPAEEIQHELASQKYVFVLGEDDIQEQSHLLTGIHEIRNKSLLPSTIQYIPMQTASRLEMIANALHCDVNILEEAMMPPMMGDEFVIGAAPGGQMSRGLLFDIAAYLSKMNRFSAFATKCSHPLISVIGIESQCSKRSTVEKKPINLLFLSHPGLIDISNILNDVAENGVILVLGRSVAEASIWPLFSSEMRQFIEKMRISIYSLDGTLLDEYRTIDRYGAYVVHGALLELISKCTGSALCFDALKQNRLLSDSAFERLNVGRSACREVDRSISHSDPFDPYFAPQIKLPQMQPAAQNHASSADWRSSVRNFFVRGQSTDAHHHPLPGLSIRPAALNPYLQELEREHYYPLLVTRIVGNPTLKTQRLDEALRQKIPNLVPNSTSDLALTQFIACAEKLADASLHITPAKVLLSKVLETIQAQNPDFDPTILAGIREFIATSDAESHLVGLNPHTLLDLYVLSVRAARRSRMRDVGAEIRCLINQLHEALRVDDAYGPFSISESALCDAFGPAANELIDSSAIAKDLSHQHCGHIQHDPERIARMHDALQKLENFHKTLATSDDLIFAYPPEVQVKSTYDRVRTICHEEPIAVATGLFDAISQKHVEAFKAMRMARLDIDNAFDPNYHGDILEHFTWQDLSEDELRLLPVICIAETTDRLYGQLTPLSRLIRAGKPMDVLVFESTSKAMSTDPTINQRTYDPGFSYLATAYREAFVAQSSLARPEHLAANLARMNRVLRPAITVVACPTWTWRLPARVQLEAAHYGRTAPMFQYDPSVGETRVERFNVDGNPQIDQPWPECMFSYLDEYGNTQTMEGTFTFAHALALEPGYHKYFRILPTEAWNDELIEIGDFLKNPSFDRPRIPFIWGVVDSKLRKCIMTREVANACIDRMQRWKTLRELSLSTQAQLMIAQDNRDSKREQELQASQKAYDSVSEQLNDTKSALKEAVDTLSTCLCELQDKLSASERDKDYDLNEAMRDETAFIEGLAGDAAVKIDCAPVNPIPAQEVKVEAVKSPKQPYIDSSKCMSCGACVGINDKVFGFNDDGQAVIIKPDATAEECADAADTCPAGCIFV